MELAFSSESGLQPLNEDACQAWEPLGLFAVCDGLSVGKGGGEAASRAALQSLGQWGSAQAELLTKARSFNSKLIRDTVQARLGDAFQEASRTVFQAALADPKLQQTCTTMDAVLLLGSHALVAHVGSGRVYLIRKGELHQLTEDHTMLAHLRRSGKLAEVPADQKAAYAKRLMRAVGFREEVQADLMAVELEAGDRFVAVTDGVWTALSEEELEKILLSGGKAAALLKGLHDRVGPGKAKDNFTSLVLDPPVAAPAAAGAGAETKIKMLGTVPAFSFLSYQELIRVINTGELVKLGSGHEIWKEGATGDEMMLVLSGSVEILKNGKRLSVLGRGDVLGEMSMIDSAPRSASVVTAAPTNLLAFPREALFSLLREEQELAVKFLWGVSLEMNKRLREMSSQLAGGAPSAGPSNGGPSGSASPNSAAVVPFHRSQE
ncbi:MAG: cyclic nucleotide-binding domain-containing protein [Bdellovibrionota bacterium]